MYAHIHVNDWFNRKDNEEMKIHITYLALCHIVQNPNGDIMEN